MSQIESDDPVDELGFRLSGLLDPGVPGMPWHPQILADQLTLSQSGGQIMPT